MACACKVSKYLNRVEQRYGTNIRSTKKTDISGKIKTFFKKVLIWIVCLPFIPIVFIYLLLRKCLTNKPISIDNLIKIKK